MDDDSDSTFKTMIISVLAGAIGGAICDLVIFPIDSIKTRIQASNAKKDFVK